MACKVYSSQSCGSSSKICKSGLSASVANAKSQPLGGTSIRSRGKARALSETIGFKELCGPRWRDGYE